MLFRGCGLDGSRSMIGESSIDAQMWGTGVKIEIAESMIPI